MLIQKDKLLTYEEEVELVREQAENDGNYQVRCIKGEKIFYVAGDRAVLPGQIYSEAGMKEYKISKCCEYHFDEWFGEDDE